MQDKAAIFREFLALQLEISRLRDWQDRLNASLTESKSRLSDIQHSRSWQITAPLRTLDAALRGIRQPPAAEDPGAPPPRTPATEPIIYPEPRRQEEVMAIDMSASLEVGNISGIQRVTFELTTEALKLPQVRCLPFFVTHSGGARQWRPRAPATPLSALDMEKLLLLDAGWRRPAAIRQFLKKCHRLDIVVISCVYDLIPIDFPEWFPPGFGTTFRTWLDSIIELSDAVVCISKTTATRLRDYVSHHPHLPRRLSRIGWWPLGAKENDSRRIVQPWYAPEQPYALMVGTIEPRKNHRFVIDAFSHGWRTGELDQALVIAGRYGWGAENVLEGLASHPEFGRRLWWFPVVNDDELSGLYDRCAAVLMASSAEGFGLPVVEGARFGKAVVLSDIPIFREIVANDGYFFRPGDAASFHKSLLQTLDPGAAPTRVQDRELGGKRGYPTRFNTRRWISNSPRL